MLATRYPLLQPKHVLHVVNTGFLRHDPLCSAQSPTSEDRAIARFVSEFEPFAKSGKHHGVIAHDVSAAQRVNSDFGWFSFARDAFAAVTQGGLVEFTFLENNFEQSRRSSAGCVFFETMMHLDHFRI